MPAYQYTLCTAVPHCSEVKCSLCCGALPKIWVLRSAKPTEPHCMRTKAAEIQPYGLRTKLAASY